MGYADNIGTPIDIPFGFRIEIVNEREYVISCLGYSMCEGLFDHSCRVKDGMIQAFHSHKKPYKNIQELLITTRGFIV